jgi:hypothetical protein
MTIRTSYTISSLLPLFKFAIASISLLASFQDRKGKNMLVLLIYTA